jgi:hypothetical protein
MTFARPLLPRLLGALAFALALAGLALVGLAPIGAAHAQDADAIRTAYAEGVQAAKANNADVAYDKLAEARRLAEEAEQTGAARQIGDILLKLPKKWGNEALKNKDYEAALRHFDQGIEFDAEEAYFYYGRGLALLNLDRTDDGLAAIARAMEVGEATGDRKTARTAEERLQDHFVAEASAALASANPTPAQADRALAQLDAMTEYVEADERAFFYRAVAHNVKRQSEQAIEAAQQGLELHRGGRSSAAKFYFTMAEAQIALGRTQAACENFQQATYGDYKPRAEHYIENQCGGQ